MQNIRSRSQNGRSNKSAAAVSKDFPNEALADLRNPSQTQASVEFCVGESQTESNLYTIIVINIFIAFTVFTDRMMITLLKRMCG